MQKKVTKLGHKLKIICLCLDSKSLAPTPLLLVTQPTSHGDLSSDVLSSFPWRFMYVNLHIWLWNSIMPTEKACFWEPWTAEKESVFPYYLSKYILCYWSPYTLKFIKRSHCTAGLEQALLESCIPICS